MSGQQSTDLYCDQATSEQSHSELRTEPVLKHLPSGRFDTNNLILAFTTVGYNLLLRMGLRVTGPDAPVRHLTERSRLRTTMQELMTMTCRLVNCSRQWFLRFRRHCPDFAGYRNLYRALLPSDRQPDGIWPYQPPAG
tara:strand:+ start:169 stop:582 length:414 start_codon:yes stop_codon:yes gene_type:complete